MAEDFHFYKFLDRLCWSGDPILRTAVLEKRAIVIVEDFSFWFLLGFELCDINSFFPAHMVFRVLDRRLRIS